MDEEIENLENSKTQFNENEINVNHKLMFTMVDGKICIAVTHTTYTQKCYICGTTSTEFNCIDKLLVRKMSTERLHFGISILQGYINCFEYLLRVAYKQFFEKWEARGSDKEKMAETKRRIQTQFKEKLGFIVDKPKPGFGNTNDGNTARRFFQNAEVSAEITNLDLELIKRIHNILIVISSGHEIDVEKLKTAKLFVEKYPWFYMSPTLHKNSEKIILENLAVKNPMQTSLINYC